MGVIADFRVCAWQTLMGELDKSISMPSPEATHKLVANAQNVVARWWLLADELMEKYADGNVDGNPEGYPAWWLKAVGFPSGPPPVPAPTTDWNFFDITVS